MKTSLHEISGSQEIQREFRIVLEQNAANFVDPAIAGALGALSEKLDPPSNNMGGNLPSPPLFLPHSEKSPDFVVNKTKIDWLAFTSLAELPVLQLVLETIWPGVVFSRNSHGMPGYPDSYSVILHGVQYGQIGTGAKHGRNFVSLTGTSCSTLNDELVDVFFQALSLPAIDATLSRLDLCLDLYRGERTFDHARWSYDRGAFNRRNGGVDPELKLVGTTKGGMNLGRTMYVGKRGGHVMARIYEKGLEVFAKLPEDQRLLSEYREAELAGRALGDPVEGPLVADNWLRLEVEYRRQGKDILLPLDMMVRRDEYFAGAYPYFADALGVSEDAGVRPKGMKTDFDVDLAAMIANAKKSYGSLVHSLLELGATSDDVVHYLSSGRNNNRLVKSGLLAQVKSFVDEFRAADPDADIPF